jgi:hypothetical protein
MSTKKLVLEQGDFVSDIHIDPKTGAFGERSSCKVCFCGECSFVEVDWLRKTFPF